MLLTIDIMLAVTNVLYVFDHMRPIYTGYILRWVQVYTFESTVPTGIVST